MIELATIEDLDIIMKIYNDIKVEMRRENNPQWGSNEDDYPDLETVKNDILSNCTFKYVEDGIIKGIVSIVIDNEREYDEYIVNSQKKAYIIHRLAVPAEYRRNNIANKLIIFSENFALQNGAEILKSDTEVSNVKMHNLFSKSGFIYKGNFSYDDYPGNYKYYEKDIKRR